MRIFYWNIGKKGTTENTEFYQAISEIANNYSPDIICFSEFENFNDDALFEKGYSLVDNAFCDKAKCYKKNNADFVQIRIGDRYCFVKHDGTNSLFVFLHAYDAKNYDEDIRLLDLREIKGEIDEYLKGKAGTNVFLVGDFNCMPYSKSITSKGVLNCTLFRNLLNARADAKERYYNPMLLLLSEKDCVYGSFFSDSLPDNLRWYLLDQVIVNKDADKIIDYGSIKLMTKIGQINILKNGKPDSDLFSDHLPLYFEIKESKHE